jgi:3-hydroxyisobutyrate dehydrogenase
MPENLDTASPGEHPWRRSGCRYPDGGLVTATHPKPVGFIGLGSMGTPMAINLAKAGVPLLVWNRSRSKSEALSDAGAAVAKDAAEVLARSDVVILMLADGVAMDMVLGRGQAAFEDRIKGRMLINMATMAPPYSKALDADIRAAGGRYVEAPVSGSRKPAEAGKLVAMLAGEPEDLALVRPFVSPMCASVMECGRPPNALLMKLAVNLFLITMVTGLVEAMHFAQRHGLDPGQLAAVLHAGPMASDVSRGKLAKLVAQDFAVEGAITNVLENNRLIAEAARRAHIASPLLDASHALYAEAKALGFGELDMIAVIRAIERRTAAIAE